jgi:Tol biopolymer transport system component
VSEGGAFIQGRRSVAGGLAAMAVAALLLCPATSHATFPGRNGKIAFDLPNGHGIYLTGPGGKGRRLVTRSPSADREPALSRRGRLAFERERARGASSIFSRSGRRLRSLTGSGPTDIQPSWAPDGRRVAFARAVPTDSGRANTGFDIYVARVGSGKLRQVTRDPGNDTQPAWSPNGKRIAFTSDRFGDQDVFTVRPNGRGLRRLTKTAAEDSAASWSPNGRRIAFASDRQGSQDVFVMTARGKALRRLTRSAREEGDPAWSPNGKRIAYAVEGRGLYVMNRSGKRKRRLKGGRGGAHPDWAPR